MTGEGGGNRTMVQLRRCRYQIKPLGSRIGRWNSVRYTCRSNVNVLELIIQGRVEWKWQYVPHQEFASPRNWQKLAQSLREGQLELWERKWLPQGQLWGRCCIAFFRSGVIKETWFHWFVWLRKSGRMVMMMMIAVWKTDDDDEDDEDDCCLEDWWWLLSGRIMMIVRYVLCLYIIQENDCLGILIL